jgi:hypothetical protein
MKDNKLLFLAFGSVCVTCSLEAQGTFENLDFESANIPSMASVNSLIPVSEALPGWSAFFVYSGGDLPQTQVSYDGISLGGAVISIVDANEPVPDYGPLQGNYSAFLFGGPRASAEESAGISQTGLVPSGTASLLVDAYVSGASFTVTLGGQTIDMVPLESFVHYTLWGGNIPSGMAGQSETLSFVEPASAAVAPTMLELDDISFSPITVTPEPGPLALMGIGGLLFALYRRFALKG